MGEPFERTMGIVNGILKPMGQSLRENPIPPYQDYAHLGTAMVESEIEHYQDIAAAMADRDRRVALFEFGMAPQLFQAFDYNDDRVLSTGKMREQIEEFFTTTMA
jgi:hypothetical protein